MKLAQQDLARLADESGFQADSLERVLQLLELLEALVSHPYLSARLALKGGTALNLFVLDLPRLSVDVDLNYVGATDRETMLAERPTVERAVQAVCSRQGLRLRRAPGDHAGGKWRLQYQRAAGGSSALELDLNYLLRVPLWPVGHRTSMAIGSASARNIAVLDEHELLAGKLTALLAREASRDVFDAHRMLRRGGLDERKLRLAFLVYGAASRRDWRTVSIEDVRMDPLEADRRLLPLLRQDLVPRRRNLGEWCTRLVTECRALLGCVLPLAPHECEFLGRMNERGEIAPELLSEDPLMQARIRVHPALLWKALSVRRYLARESGDTGKTVDSDGAGDC